MTAQPADKTVPTSRPRAAVKKATATREPATDVAVLDAVAEPAGLIPAQKAPADAEIGVPQQQLPAQYAPTQVNVQVSAPAAPQIVIAVHQRGLFVRALYFLFVGWWLSGWAILAAGVCIASVVLLPAGLAIVNRIPQIMTLRPRSTAVNAAMLADGSMQYTVGNAEQRSMLVRTAYFCLIGWWAGMLAMAAAWLMCVLIVTMPLGLMIINRAPAVFTLRRN